MHKVAIILVCIVPLYGCARTIITPHTPAAQLSGYTYIPVDPFPVPPDPDKLTCPNLEAAKSKEEYDRLFKQIKYRPLLESLPDNAVRMSIEQFDSSGKISYGPAGIGTKGQSFWGNGRLC